MPTILKTDADCFVKLGKGLVRATILAALPKRFRVRIPHRTIDGIDTTKEIVVKEHQLVDLDGVPLRRPRA